MDQTHEIAFRRSFLRSVNAFMCTYVQYIPSNASSFYYASRITDFSVNYLQLFTERHI